MIELHMIQYSVVIQFVNMCIYMHMERDRLSPEELLENLPCKTLLKFHDLAVFLNSCGCRRCRVKAKGSGCYGSDHFRTEGLDACGFVGRRRIPMWVVVKIIFPVWVPIIIRHLLFRVPKNGTLLLTTTHVELPQDLAQLFAAECSTHKRSPRLLRVPSCWFLTSANRVSFKGHVFGATVLQVTY